MRDSCWLSMIPRHDMPRITMRQATIEWPRQTGHAVHFHEMMRRHSPFPIHRESHADPSGQRIRHGLLELGSGPPLVCVHGTLGDFRTWSPVMGPLSENYRVIAVSLRHFFPEHWDGIGSDYLMSQHVADVITFIEQIEPKPVNLMGHSRGGHISFRVAEARPDLLRKLILAEPGGDLDATLDPAAAPVASSALSARIAASAAKVKAGDIEGALQGFF